MFSASRFRGAAAAILAVVMIAALGAGGCTEESGSITVGEDLGIGTDTTEQPASPVTEPGVQPGSQPGSVTSEPVVAEPTQKLAAATINPNVLFGASVAIEGSIAAVGATGDNNFNTGVQTVASSGAVYILSEANGLFDNLQKIAPSDGENGDEFGFSVAMDGDYMIVGATGSNQKMPIPIDDAGGAYIFHKDANGNWVEEARLSSDQPQQEEGFGFSVAISGDKALVGARWHDDSPTAKDSGAAYLYQLVQGKWVFKKAFTAPTAEMGEYFGESVSISGDYAFIGASRKDASSAEIDAGAVYVFRNNAGNWELKDTLQSMSNFKKSSYFGYAVSVRGNYAVIGAPREGDGTLGALGAAYVYELVGDNWNMKQRISSLTPAAWDQFGGSVFMSDKRLIVGAPGYDKDKGSAYVFEMDDAESWNLTDIFMLVDPLQSDKFGTSVSVGDKFAIVGVPNRDNSINQPESGEAFIFSIAD